MVSNAEEIKEDNAMPLPEGIQNLPILATNYQAESQANSSNDSSESFAKSIHDFPVELVKHIWNGQTAYLEKLTWLNFFGGKHDVSNSNSSATSLPPKSNDTPALQMSTSIPPGFSHKQSSSTSRSARKALISRKHKKFLQHISSSKSASKIAKKGSGSGKATFKLADALEDKPISRCNGV
ncbi:uncharacterized protein LOC109844082 isoform X2 [Asparagus officinalis]|uniref:uncharacterized protein LOC109844082 isoform X2 n=1 Tax=Asparagus officinalis TaxID=4686 RepID=UPI00098E1381|nr:uncharacterized protein LOC109844082 isoform X2 [Asparagus officinalis]